MELIEKRGGACCYADPHVPVIPPTREHADFVGRKSVDITAETLTGYHAVLISTDHDAVDYTLIRDNARLVIDTRNVFAVIDCFKLSPTRSGRWLRMNVR